MGYRDLFRLIGVFIISSIAFGTSAFAAPQILAVLATDTGIPFSCEDGLCRAELSTYCLQRKRPSPNAGTVYHPAAAEDFILSVKTASGKTRNLPAAPHVAFIEARGFMSITAIIEARELKRLGSLNAMIRIGENASMIPQSVPGDINPLTEKEIAYATGSLRQHGQDIVDAKPQAFAARLLTRVLNVIPDNGPIMPGTSEQLWHDAIGDEAPANAGFGQARQVYGECFSGAQEMAYGSGVRRCLEFRHDELIRDLNIDYWNSQPSG